MTTTEKSAAIRKALKAAGYSSRQVSVRAESFSMGSSLYVTIKDMAVPMALCTRIAGEFESISRCESSGEILSGGNTYLHVEYSRDALTAAAAPVLAQIPARFNESGTAIVEGWFVSEDGGRYFATRSGATLHCWGRECLAREIVTANLARAHKPRFHVTAVCTEVLS